MTTIFGSRFSGQNQTSLEPNRSKPDQLRSRAGWLPPMNRIQTLVQSGPTFSTPLIHSRDHTLESGHQWQHNPTII
ncbi:hypothetical protein Hanom_Chr01g00074051 [Helianthus anomalus]